MGDALPVVPSISIHALREEGDRPPASELGLCENFYPRPPRGGRPAGIRRAWQRIPISIHALREEGDAGSRYSPRLQQYFYPRPPRGGRRNRSTTRRPARRFLSTPSARRATQPFRPKLCKKVISIHALREEGDAWRWLMVTFTVKFLSTPSARRATGGNFTAFHALGKFLSTPSARRATWLSSLSARRWRISIHALREEGDRRCNGTPLKCLIFLSTPSARRATFGSTAAIIEYNKFLSTPSARRATCPHNPSSKPHWYFYPRPPRGGRP